MVEKCWLQLSRWGCRFLVFCLCNIEKVYFYKSQKHKILQVFTVLPPVTSDCLQKCKLVFQHNHRKNGFFSFLSITCKMKVFETSYWVTSLRNIKFYKCLQYYRLLLLTACRNVSWFFNINLKKWIFLFRFKFLKMKVFDL